MRRLPRRGHHLSWPMPWPLGYSDFLAELTAYLDSSVQDSIKITSTLW